MSTGNVTYRVLSSAIFSYQLDGNHISIPLKYSHSHSYGLMQLHDMYVKCKLTKARCVSDFKKKMFS